jgi:hypothetical protein
MMNHVVHGGMAYAAACFGFWQSAEHQMSPCQHQFQRFTNITSIKHG